MNLKNTNICVLNSPQGFSNAMTGGYRSYINTSLENNENSKLLLSCKTQNILGFTRQTVSVTAKQDVFVTALASFYIDKLFYKTPFSSLKNIYLLVCKNTWQGEGQWQKLPLSELNFSEKNIHAPTDSFHIVNIGSFTTANYYPDFYLVDEISNKVHYFSLEPSGNYHFELGLSADANLDYFWFVNIESVNDRYLNSGLNLRSGQTKTADTATYKCIDGDFNDAIREVFYYKNTVFNQKYSPLVFNDYLNCLWGNPSLEKLLPLINQASLLQAEVFCIDAGWFMPLADGANQILGEWNFENDRFGYLGFKGLIKYITDKGMKAGCWLEMEAVTKESSIFNKPDSWFLVKYGFRICGGTRYSLNFANIEVRNYMRKKIDSLYEIGIRFIKNDYNDCIGSGAYFDGCSLGEGLQIALRAFYSFIDEIKRDYPDLIIENCGSGAMRSDYGALQHFDLQSCTDQEDSFKAHIITMNSLVNILPKHLGVWACPYPQKFVDKDKNFNNVNDFENGQETAFCLVNGLLGNLYLSGRIDKADKTNFNLIKLGLEFFKANRDFLFSTPTVFPLELPSLSKINNFSCALKFSRSKGFLFVFKLGELSTVNIDLSKWYRSFNAKFIFSNKTVPFNISASIINIIFPENCNAVIFSITDK